jgi:hypothetical protein
LSNLWEEHDDVKEIDDTINSLYDLSLRGDSIHNYVIESTFHACKYYERVRDKSPLYVSMLFKMQATDHYMYWLLLSCCYLFIYKIPMHMKRVRLKKPVCSLVHPRIARGAGYSSTESAKKPHAKSRQSRPPQQAR